MKSRSGQSLLEVTFAIGIVVLVLVSALSALLVGFRNARLAQEQTAATQAAQSAIEWVRQQRDAQGWGPFLTVLQSKAGGGNSARICLPSIPTNWTEFIALPSGECSREGEIDVMTDNSALRRELEIVIDSAVLVEVRSRVFRLSSTGEAETLILSQLSKWDEE